MLSQTTLFALTLFLANSREIISSGEKKAANVSEKIPQVMQRKSFKLHHQSSHLACGSCSRITFVANNAQIIIRAAQFFTFVEQENRFPWFLCSDFIVGGGVNDAQ